MRFVCTIFVISYLLSLVSAGDYFAQLKAPFTADDLFKQDDSIKATHHVRDSIKSRISFGGFEGFSGKFEDDVLQRLLSNPLVAKVTPDIVVNALHIDQQTDAPKHLARLSQEGPVSKNPDSRAYCFDSEHEGEGVTAYVVDTGVNTDHPELEGRAVSGPNFSASENCNDKVGHGTHVAGLIGSKTYGVAKKINIVSIKVLDDEGSGTLSSVIGGLEFAVKHRQDSGMPGVVNLSLGAYKNVVLDEAVMATYKSGMVVVVAAGNNNIDACNTSPAGSPFAISVGAIDDTSDKIAPFSNWGPCINVFSSGIAVESLCGKNEESPTNLSGTSMASPVVAGLAGILLDKGVDYKDVAYHIDEMSIRGVIPKNSLVMRRGSPNKVASNGIRCY
ncbi:unnamed protein product [Kuraishia capsulata CBS 1993]|uniref:Uncharacterized protein n=1 Tax=Kuraishia capsulata CBS 1993 TaxID=1382522 RepID=W6MNV4_9ASCO|nr:uncharacterized protein KUCA_T00002716001 [Kuraishia capsulata CBS 1993]CDK26742.1 unnamed protein product [Kuraishia capsulata CBS 1993]